MYRYWCNLTEQCKCSELQETLVTQSLQRVHGDLPAADHLIKQIIESKARGELDRWHQGQGKSLLHSVSHRCVMIYKSLLPLLVTVLIQDASNKLLV